MHEDSEQLDEELSRLAQSFRGGDHMLACLQLAEFALKLDHYIRTEERVLRLETVREEHTRLRELVSFIANALDRADDRDAVELVGKLRSVLLLHVEKEERLLTPARSYAVH